MLLLADDGHLVLERPRVVGPDLRPEAVLERRDDPATRGVILRIGRGDHVQVERQADDEAADLDVALLEDVEQADLDPFGQVRQLVDRDDAPVGARDQAVVERQLVGQVAAFGDLDRVDLADQVGDRDIGRGELFGIAAVARQPVDRGGVAVTLDDRTGGRADRRERVVIELAAMDDRAATGRAGRPAAAPSASWPGLSRRGRRGRGRPGSRSRSPGRRSPRNRRRPGRPRRPSRAAREGWRAAPP